MREQWFNTVATCRRITGTAIISSRARIIEAAVYWKCSEHNTFQHDYGGCSPLTICNLGAKYCPMTQVSELEMELRRDCLGCPTAGQEKQNCYE
jgi:hypothetical protein